VKELLLQIVFEIIGEILKKEASTEIRDMLKQLRDDIDGLDGWERIIAEVVWSKMMENTETIINVFTTRIQELLGKWGLPPHIATPFVDTLRSVMKEAFDEMAGEQPPFGG